MSHCEPEEVEIEATPPSEANNSVSETEFILSQRVAQLEKKLDEALLMLSDVYRYGKLKNLLERQKWQQADQETTLVMLEIAGQKNHDNLTPEDLTIFSCNGLQVIDQLWRRYSNDRFGFSIQLQIYLGEGGSIDTLRSQNIEMLRKVGAKIGWYKDNRWLEYKEVDFSSSSVLGSLPCHWWHSPYGAKMANYFFTRLLSCGFEGK